jgi:hypothetical protein
MPSKKRIIRDVRSLASALDWLQRISVVDTICPGGAPTVAGGAAGAFSVLKDAKMSSSNTSQSSVFDEVVVRLEQALCTTRVPGELIDWVEPVRTSLRQSRHLVKEESMPRHKLAFLEMGKEDLALQPRIEQLRDEDSAILDDIVRAEELASAICRRLETSDGKVEEREKTDELFELGQSIALRLKKQEQDIRTWLMEAFQRDRGVAD